MRYKTKILVLIQLMKYDFQIVKIKYTNGNRILNQFHKFE